MNLTAEKFDIVVIGGGAVGSGISLDATLRGYKVLLLEKMILEVEQVLKAQSWFMEELDILKKL